MSPVSHSIVLLATPYVRNIARKAYGKGAATGLAEATGLLLLVLGDGGLDGGGADDLDLELSDVEVDVLAET